MLQAAVMADIISHATLDDPGLGMSAKPASQGSKNGDSCISREVSNGITNTGLMEM